MKKLKEFMQLFFIILGSICFIAIAGTAGKDQLYGLDLNVILVRCVPALILLIICAIATIKLGDKDDSEMSE